MDREEYIQGLRDIADFYESRPDLPLPSSGVWITIWEKSLTSARERGLQMAPCEKHYIGDSFFELRRYFGPHQINITWNRDDVCERVQVGVREVPEQVIPAHTEPVYEWDCSKPILGSGSGKEITQGDNVTT